MAVARDPTTGAALLSATINVYNPGTVVAISATIFDKNGNTLTNPLTSDPTTGLIDFYLNVAQEVDLVVAKAGYTTRTYSNVPVIDDASFDLSALMTTTGDTVYASGANTPARLAIGSANQVLNVSGGLPAWSSTLTSVTLASGTLSGTTNQSGNVVQQTNATLTAAAANNVVLNAPSNQMIALQYNAVTQAQVSSVGLEIVAGALQLDNGKTITANAGNNVILNAPSGQLIAAQYNAVTQFSIRSTGSRFDVLPAFVASDKYLVADASGNVHVSALGPAS